MNDPSPQQAINLATLDRIAEVLQLRNDADPDSARSDILTALHQIRAFYGSRATVLCLVEGEAEQAFIDRVVNLMAGLEKTSLGTADAQRVRSRATAARVADILGRHQKAGIPARPDSPPKTGAGQHEASGLGDGRPAQVPYERTSAGAPADSPSGRDSSAGLASAESDADRAVIVLYRSHYRALVRLSVLLVRDVSTAEEVVSDSFVAMHAAWRRLHDTEKALSYLRQCVVNESRSVLRTRIAADRNMPQPPGVTDAEQGAISELERSAVVKALRNLPARQREAIVLRYYADLSEAQIAAAMGIRRGAVRSHTAHGMAALRSVLEDTPESGTGESEESHTTHEMAALRSVLEDTPESGTGESEDDMENMHATLASILEEAARVTAR